MGLETATFIGGLTAAWPLANDKKAQGDDHIRLVKSVLQATFPNATKAFYFPVAEISSSNQIIAADDNQKTLYLETTGGNVTATLPTLAAADAGFEVKIVKADGSANAIIVSPPSGTIVSRVGTTATIRVGVPWEPAIFNWSGSAWICFKPGVLIGETSHFNGPSVPPGYLLEDGSAYSNTAFAELFAVLGASTLKDKRGRADIGAGTGSGLTNRTLGTTHGAEQVALVTANLPPYTPSGSVSITEIKFDTRDFLPTAGGSNDTSRLSQAQTGGNITIPSGNPDPFISAVASFSGVAQGGVSSPINLLQPSIASQKIIRAC